MPSTETAESASTSDAVAEKRPPKGGVVLPVLLIAVGGLLTVAWFWMVVLLGSWLIRDVL